MKSKKAMPRKSLAKKSHTQPVRLPETTNDHALQRGEHKSSEQERIMSKTPGGNFSVFRELLKKGGKGEDARWIIGLRSTKPTFSKEK